MCLCQTSCSYVPEGCPKNPKIGPTWGAGLSGHVQKPTWRAPRVVTDFFVACIRVTEFYTCCSFCWKTHDDGFWLLVTDLFVAHKHSSDVHLDAFGSQNRNGDRSFGQTCLLKPMLSAKIQTHATPLTITVPGNHPHPHGQHHCAATCNLESAICAAMLN